MSIEIRPMARADKPAVMQIIRTTPEFSTTDVKVAEELIECYLDDPLSSGYHIHVVETEARVIGYVCYGPTPLTESTWDLYWIAIARDKQEQGIGNTLLAFTEDKIKEAKGRLIIIETSSTPVYKKTVHFYINRGYKIICRIPDFYAPGDDKLILQKQVK